MRRATGPTDVAHLRAIGERLAAAAHPGVVEVIHSTGDSEWWELHLAFAGQPVDRLGRLTVEQVAGVAAALTTTLADLHAGGLTILLVEQNANAALEIADRGLVLEAGTVRLAGSAAELLASAELRASYLGDGAGF